MTDALEPVTTQPVNPLEASAPAGQPAPKAISFKFGADGPDLDRNHLERIKEANTYHSPVEARIRDYKAKAQAVAEAQKPVSGEAPAGGSADKAGGAEGNSGAPQAPKSEEIVEDGLTYSVEGRPDGYYVTKTTDTQGNVTPYDDGIFLGEHAPKGTEKSFMDKLGELTAKDVAVGAKDAVKGAFVGADVGLIKLATNAVRTLVDNPLGKHAIGEDNVEAYNTFANWLGGELDKARDTITKDTTAGKVGAFVGEAGGNFVAPAIGAYGKLRSLGASPLLAAALGDVGVAVFGVNPDQENLSALLPEGPLRELMATDPKDPSWMNRARNATEALATIGVADVGAKTIVKIVGEVNQFVKANKLPPAFMEAIEKFIKDDSGSFSLPRKGARKLITPELEKRMLSKANDAIDGENWWRKKNRQYSEGEAVLDENGDWVETINQEELNPDLPKITSMEDLQLDKNATHDAMGDAFEAVLDDLGIDYNKPRSGSGSKYYEINTTDGIWDDEFEEFATDDKLKFRFSDHEKTSNQHSEPHINVTTENKGFSNSLGDAIKFIEKNADKITTDSNKKTLAQKLAGEPGTLERFIKDDSGALTIGGPKKGLQSPEKLNKPARPTKEVMDKYSNVEEVPLDLARSTQNVMEWDNFNKGEHPGQLIDGYGDKPVAVRLENGEYLIYDGHHRTTSALNKGDKTLSMYVIDAKKYDPQNAGVKKAPSKPGEDDDLLRELGVSPKKKAELPAGPQRSEVMDKAIAALGPIKPGQPAIADQVVADMRKAIEDNKFIGFGTDAREGVDFNIARMQDGEEIGDLINKVSEVYKDPTYKAKRGVQTFDATQEKADLAREMGFSVEDIISRPDGSTWNAETMKAARDIFVGEVEKTRALAEAIKSPGGDSQEALVAFRRQLAVLSAVQMSVKGAQTEAARALSQFRMTAKSPLEASVLVRDILDQAGGHDANAKMVDAFLNLSRQSNDASALARFARQAEGIKTTDMLYEAWINSLLGAPTTHIVNVSGNALATAQGVVERYAAAGYGAVERTALKLLGKDAGPDGIRMTEANAYARGMAMSIFDALTMAGKAMKTGQGQDMFQKLGYGAAITSQNINELPIAKSIAGRLGKDELLKTNSTMALFADRLGEYYFRLPGRFLMSEDEFFKTLTYRAELNAQSAREAASLNLSPEQAAARRYEVMQDPQVAAPNIHLASQDNAREFTFTQPAGEIAGPAQRFINAVPGGRVVIPFFGVINNITKFVGSRMPGAALMNPRSQTYKDLFSGDAAKRQLVAGKWATGGAIAGLAAWLNQNGQLTGRLTDNPKLRKTMESQGKMAYGVRIPMPDGSYKMLQYNRLEPIGMTMGIAATTSEVMNYVQSEEDQQNLVIAATAAILPYLEDKSFFKGAVDFINAFSPQYGDDGSKAKAMEKYIVGLAATTPGAVLGPLAPGTPASRWARRELAGDTNRRASNADPYRVVKDQWGDDVLTPNDEFEYRAWEGVVKKIMDATPGLSSLLPSQQNLWGEDIVMENGLFSASTFSPLATSKLKYDVAKLEKSNLPDAMKNGYFNGMMIGRDISLEQFKTFVNIAGIDGELERLGSPLAMPSKQIAAKNGSQNVGLPVKMSDKDYHTYMDILNKISVPNDADSERRNMTMRQFLDWTVKQPEYATLPEDGDAKGAKGDLLKQVVKKYRIAADNLFLETEAGQLLRKRSILLQLKAQNTGAQ